MTRSSPALYPLEGISRLESFHLPASEASC